MIRVIESAFAISAAQLAGAPPVEAPEICFAGRSNVGKSSAINALLGRRKLARVSNTPGRTRLLNFFTARVDADGAERSLSFCDLPGYGYAKAPRAEIARWQGMIEGYLEGRASLRGAVLLVDSRHEVSPLDGSLLEWLGARGRPVLVVATKADKLAKNRLHGAVRALERQLGVPGRGVLPFSAETGLGRDELWREILAL